MSALSQLTEAVEVLSGRREASVFITCEHASQRMPLGFRWPDRDRHLIDTHWAYDLGAREMTRALAEGLDTGAVLSRYSRLLIDPNRPLDSPTLFRAQADGAPIVMNTEQLDDDERWRRIDRLWRPYHEAIDRELGRSAAPVLLAIHTFTPLYEGARRTVEVGVLFDREEQLAHEVAAGLARSGLKVSLNEPYSGKDGLMYAGELHAGRHARRAVELEVRQDLAIDPSFRHDFVALLGSLF